MRITIVGAGPAGLYSAILLKQVRPDIEVKVVEQNPHDATFGFGVVFSHQAMSFLSQRDVRTRDLITPHMERWENIEIVHRGESVIIDGVGFSAIGRLRLLQLLQARAAELGVVPQYRKRIDRMDNIAADLIIGADGLNSVVRRSDPTGFGESIEYLGNRFIWYGTKRRFERLTQTFVESDHGRFTAHHYRFEPDRSTFIIECSDDTWRHNSLGDIEPAACMSLCESLFSHSLDGAALISNQSYWRRFPQLWNRRWHKDNRVLVGDALHSAHFSIGSGTRLALEDASALVHALEDCDFNLDSALPAYQAKREPVLRKMVEAATHSGGWYDNFGQHMDLPPWPFALSYIRRSRRFTDARLRAAAPNFYAELERRSIVPGNG